MSKRLPNPNILNFYSILPWLHSANCKMTSQKYVINFRLTCCFLVRHQRKSCCTNGHLFQYGHIISIKTYSDVGLVQYWSNLKSNKKKSMYMSVIQFSCSWSFPCSFLCWFSCSCWCPVDIPIHVDAHVYSSFCSLSCPCSCHSCPNPYLCPHPCPCHLHITWTRK